MFDQLFGDKPWFKSFTAWGSFIFILAWTAVPALGELGLIGPEVQDQLSKYMTIAAGPLTAVGIRRQLGNK
ncbi:MAG: hypothetical protein ACWGQW_23210 [bacterium]